LMPRGLIDRAGPDTFDAVAAHELAHVARHDYAWHVVQLVAEGLLFHHPAAWWLASAIDREREARCDELAGTVVEPVVLARTLAALERTLPGRRPTSSRRRPLRDRITALLPGEPWPSEALRSARRSLTSVGVLATGALLGAVAWYTAGGLTPTVQAMSLTSMAAIGLGLLVGVRHAFEPDHLMAVATLMTREQGSASAVRMGASWGIGHTASLLVMGTTLVVIERTMPAGIEVLLELGVATMIVGMGLRSLGDARRSGRGGPVQWHTHGVVGHTHATAADHVHVGPVTLARRPLAVGIVHGLAGSGALTALAASGLPTVPEQVLFVLVFGLGSTVAMAAVAGTAGWPMAHLVRSPRAMTVLSGATGVFAVAFGMAWGYPLFLTLLAR
jgi:hypothetical protein